MNNSSFSYFGASNGYHGFKSLFGEIFSPKSFNKVFVIKGGPGTGKSSLMKRVKDSIMSLGAECECIYCSSDPSSLDGVILENGNKRVAILDGTAPHETDAVYPGCKDEIVNLLDGFDDSRLQVRESEILTLVGRKKEYYKKAYLELSLAGKIHAYLLERAKEKFNFRKAFEELMSFKYDGYKARGRRILLSAFGSSGYKSLPMKKEKATVYLKGNGYSDEIMMGLLYNGESDLYKFDEVYLSPFNHAVAEGLRLGEKTVSRIESRADSVIDCDSFCSFDLSEEKELIRKEKESLYASKCYFSSASREHFRLEDIYKEAMDFTLNDRHCERITERVIKILF